VFGVLAVRNFVCVSVGQNIADGHINVIIFVVFRFPNAGRIEHYNEKENEYLVTQFRHI